MSTDPPTWLSPTGRRACTAGWAHHGPPRPREVGPALARNRVGAPGTGLQFGRGTYGEYSDAEMSLARAAWCTVLHLRPSVVVETGVARGVTSRIVLEGLDRNDHRQLWSIDLPSSVRAEPACASSAAIPDSFRRHAGPTSRDPAEDGCPRCFARSVRSSFSFTTACTPPATHDPRWNRH